MTLELAFNLLWGVVCSVIGWTLRTVWEAQKELQKDLQHIETKINEDFVRKDDYRYFMDTILARFDRLEARLEQILSNNQKGPHQ